MYFSVRGRGEFIRYIFNQAGIEFEDHRVNNDEWPKLKPNVPMGQLPVLEIDGGKMRLCQSAAIGRYLAKEFGLAGKTNAEAALCDMYIDGVTDLLPHLRPVIMALREGNEDKRKDYYEKFKEPFGEFLDRYENFVEVTGSGWFVGADVTWADLVIGEFLGRIQELFDPEAMAAFPALKEHCARVHELPNIKKYVESRPKTNF